MTTKGESDDDIYTYADGVLTVKDNAHIGLSMADRAATPTSHRIVVEEDATATIVLDNVSISAFASYSAIDIPSGAHLTLILMGENKLTGTDAPGIHLPEGASLTIQEGKDNGSLTVTGGVSSDEGHGHSGIGGKFGEGENSGENCGTVRIEGGTVNIKGGSGESWGGAGIGGGICTNPEKTGGTGGAVTITGGNVTITGGNGKECGGAGIGGGAAVSRDGGAGGTVTIEGGAVTITGGSGSDGGAGIGGGKGTYSGNGGTAVILTNAEISSIDENGGSGIKPSIEEDNSFVVYGNLTLPNPPNAYTIPKGATVTIPNGTSLTVPEGVTLINKGTIQLDGGTLTNHGTIENYGTLPEGVGGNGTVTHKVTGVALDQSTLTLIEGDTAQLTATITPDKATNQEVRWSSDPDGIVNINTDTTDSKKATVTAAAEGTATITATAADGSEVSDSCSVTVTAKTYGISVSPTSLDFGTVTEDYQAAPEA